MSFDSDFLSSAAAGVPAAVAATPTPSRFMASRRFMAGFSW
jgi:hypothetical protein